MQLCLFTSIYFSKYNVASVLIEYNKQVSTKEWAEILNNKSRHVEDAVQELVSIFEHIYEVKRIKKPPVRRFPTQGIYRQ